MSLRLKQMIITTRLLVTKERQNKVNKTYTYIDVDLSFVSSFVQTTKESVVPM